MAVARVLVVSAAVAAAAADRDHSCPLTNGTFPAAAWPSQHTRLEQMYTPLTGPEWSSKPIWYDFDNLHYRADSFFESGVSNPLTTLFNFTSIWQNQTLSMITYADPRSLQPESCIQLNLGIGMMRPDWMVAPTSSCMGDLWVTAKSAGFDEDYHRAVWTRINALPGDEGNFVRRLRACAHRTRPHARALSVARARPRSLTILGPGGVRTGSRASPTAWAS
jgi:hypothetical protein